MHFFSPANVMKLLENVRGKATDKDVIATVMNLSKKIGKIPVLVGVCEGFVGNRMLRQRGIQSAYMLEEGALPQQIDKVIFDFGFPMGPFQMSDLAGNDVGWRIRQGKKEKEKRNVRYTGYVADAICELGRFGQKTAIGLLQVRPARPHARSPIPRSRRSSRRLRRSSASRAAPSPTRRSWSGRSSRWSTRVPRSSKRAWPSARSTST